LLWYKNRKTHQWVLFQVNKIHKMRFPIYQMHSKRKYHIGCCQMCIEMAKTSAKTSKTRGAPPWTPIKAWEHEKWRLEKSKEEGVWFLHAKRPNFRGLVNSVTTIYKIVTLSLRITKMPLLGLKCWPIHSDDVKMTWKWCGNDVATLFN